MRPVQVARLDAATPRWPLARVRLEAQPVLELGGIATALDSTDPYADAREQVVAEARRRGHDLRMEVRNADTGVDRFIVRTDGTLIALDHARPRTSAGAAGASVARRSMAPAPVRPASAAGRRRQLLTWGGAMLGVLVVASIVVLVVDPTGSEGQGAQATVPAPVPAPAQLYTEQPPPGWSEHAAWALPIAKNTPVAVDDHSGTIAVLTPDDRTSTDTARETAEAIDARKPAYLSVLQADGSTRFAVELAHTPSAGPAITAIDGESVVAIVSGTTISYWPLQGPAEDQTDVEASASSAAAIDLDPHGVLVDVSTTTLATITHATQQPFDALPRTTAIAMSTGGALSIEDDTASWWLTGPGLEPVKVSPAPPNGAVGYSSTICADAAHVIVLWQSDAPSAAAYKKPGILTAYDTNTGELIAETAVDSLAQNTTAHCPSSTLSGLTAGNGFMLADAGAQSHLTLVPGLRPQAVHDAVYGTISGQPVHINATGAITEQPDAALVPVAAATEQLYVVSQWQLYALAPEK